MTGSDAVIKEGKAQAPEMPKFRPYIRSSPAPASSDPEAAAQD